MGQLDVVEIFIKDYVLPLDDNSLQWLYDNFDSIKQMVLTEQKQEQEAICIKK